jgi:hypothetical protein
MRTLRGVGLAESVNVLVTDHLSALSIFPPDALPIALLFVDAEHSYEGNASIITQWCSRVTGTMLFHDYSDEFPGMIRSVDEARPLFGPEVVRVDSLIGFAVGSPSRGEASRG